MKRINRCVRVCVCVFETMRQSHKNLLCASTCRMISSSIQSKCFMNNLNENPFSNSEIQKYFDNPTSVIDANLMTKQAIQDTLGLFFIARNIAFNNSLEFYLPRLVEMFSDLIDVERCSIFLYNCVKDSLFCTVITGRLREPITFKRES